MSISILRPPTNLADVVSVVIESTALEKLRKRKLFSYVVDHDTGDAPNPYFDVCTLCICKYRESLEKRKNVVELADKGDWVIGTGGVDLLKSAGNGKLIYAMRVTDKMTLEEYFTSPDYKCKKPRLNGDHKYGDNFEPLTDFDKHKRFVLISEHFYYFGRNAIRIPQKRFPHLEKKGRWFRSDFDDAYIARFEKWLAKRAKPGKHGEPCLQWASHEREECPRCPEGAERNDRGSCA